MAPKKTISSVPESDIAMPEETVADMIAELEETELQRVQKLRRSKSVFGSNFPKMEPAFPIPAPKPSASPFGSWTTNDCTSYTDESALLMQDQKRFKKRTTTTPTHWYQRTVDVLRLLEIRAGSLAGFTAAYWASGVVSVPPSANDAPVTRRRSGTKEKATQRIQRCPRWTTTNLKGVTLMTSRSTQRLAKNAACTLLKHPLVTPH